ncbi:hypothetical protein QTO34_009456 [Cnephaeus nilssonii]|uniref:G-protein coupled receptors family 1 profile domain-containing protein n=1 Tax=Cnephaeus nilssonii TaxID=3371016 RepID=A0AA40LGZ7_CNENI|nr:hypothetical protein QTO34_009456 [Eptesicus nilssonii]
MNYDIQVLYWWREECVTVEPDEAVQALKKYMAGQNQTAITEFLLQGLPIKSEQQNLFYALFLVMYVTTVLGNLLIIFLIRLDSQLHTPMYLFLSNLSFSDLCFSSVTMPKLLQNMQSQVPSIPYAGCLTQMYFFLFFADLESFLLVAMAYDRYVAICFPLHYTTIMSPKLSVLLDTRVNELVIFIMGGLILVIPFLLIITSYARIVSSILKVPSARGIRKAFSTCGSHLSVVSLFYGTVIVLYLFPSADNSTVKEMVMAMMYTVVTPMLNPFIYSLRNRDMKGALGRALKKYMAGHNQTAITEFLLQGLPIKSEQKNLFYALFLVIYVTTVLGNLLIIFLIRLDSQLHTPMYLFLSNLSFSDLCFSSVTMPKLLQNMQSQVPSIPYAGCLTQMYFFLFFGDLESFLLVAMAYDRYVAICFPCTTPPS